MDAETGSDRRSDSKRVSDSTTQLARLMSIADANNTGNVHG